MSALRLAIDLGTSHTVAVVRREAEPRALLFDGSPVLPSAIFSEPPRLHVGRDAERMALIDPSRFEPHPKRRVDEGSVLLGNTEVTIVDMFVALLRRVVAEAAQTGVQVGDGVVLTCPADWGAARRNILMQAATIAGLGPVQLVDEPVAAATYCMEVMSQQVPVGAAVLVFDFGGGTLDSSVLRREPGGLRVLSVGGLDDLGGIDVDAALVGHLGQLIQMQSPRVWHRITQPGTASEKRERRQFWDDVRAAKEMLSRTTSAPVHVPGTDGALHLTREELERVAGPLIDRAVDETRRVLRASGLEPNALAGLFLVGGSSRIPLVASRLHTRFGLAPVVPEQPELPVAYGGFIAAGGRTTGQATGRATAAGSVAPVRPGPPGPPHQHGPQHGPQHGRPMGTVNAPQSSPPSMPMSAPPSTQQVAGFASGPPGSYAPSSGGPVPNAPVSDAPYRSFPVSSTLPPVPQQQFGPPAPPPPGPGPMAPSMVPHRPPRRGGKLKYVIIGVVAVVALACGTGAYFVYNGVRDAFDTVAGGDPDNDKFGPAGAFNQVKAVSLAGSGALTTTVAGGVTYYAAVNGSNLDVGAVGTDGAEKWKKSYPVEPTDLRMTQTGSVLYIECEKAATHGGKNVRLVLDIATGAEKMFAPYDRERITHFVGNDAFIEVNSGSSQGRMVRMDLTTGNPKWSEVIVPGRVSSFEMLAAPVAVYAADGPNAQQGTAGPLPGTLNRAPTAPDFRQAIAVDPGTFVGYDKAKTTFTVFNAADGKPRGSGQVPFDGELFSAYQGVVVGELSDKVSAGRVTVAGYGLDNFAKRWELGLPAGARLEQIKPCGPQHMCVLYNANSTYTLTSMDLQSGKEAWKENFARSRPDWYLLKSGLLMGGSQIGNIGKPALHDPASGVKKQALDGGITSVTAVGADGKWVLIRTSRYLGGSTGSVNTLAVVDVTTGNLSSGIDVGKSLDQIENASIQKGVASAVSENRQLVIASVPA